MTELPIKAENMRVLPSLALACALLCCGCSVVQALPHAAASHGSALQAEPRGIVGEPCPPVLAAKGYC